MATFGDIKISTINGGPLSGMRNAVINGNFSINQRAVTGTVTLAAGDYGHDRFKAGAGGCTYTFATSQNVTTLTITAGTLIQVIEGANLLTDTYTLTFTGTAQGKIGAGSFGAAGITGSVTGGTNLNVEFNTGTVSLVQLERGTVATPFEFRSIGQELALCQRYYETSYSYGVSPGTATQNGANQQIISTGWLTSDATKTFLVPKRAPPTVTVYNTANGASGQLTEKNSGGTNVANRPAGAQLITTSSCLLGVTDGSQTVTAGQHVYMHYAASSEL